MLFSTRRTAGALVAVGLGIGLTGCGGGDERPAAVEATFLHGAGGVNERVGQVLLRDVSIDEPDDGQHEPGDVVRLKVTLFNEAQDPDALLAVSTPVASESRLLVDRDCDGTAEVVGEVPLPPQPAVRTPAPGVPNGPEVDYRVDLRLDEPLGPGRSVPVTFTFERAGSTTFEVPVELTDQPLQEDVTRCEPSV